MKLRIVAMICCVVLAAMPHARGFTKCIIKELFKVPDGDGGVECIFAWRYCGTLYGFTLRASCGTTVCTCEGTACKPPLGSVCSFPMIGLETVLTDPLADGTSQVRRVAANRNLDAKSFRINNSADGKYDPNNVSEWVIPDGTEVSFVSYAKDRQSERYFVLYRVVLSEAIVVPHLDQGADQIPEMRSLYVGFRLRSKPAGETRALEVTPLPCGAGVSQQEAILRTEGIDGQRKWFHLIGIGG